MDKRDYNRFVQALNATLSVYDKKREDIAVAMWWKLLERFDIRAVEAALLEHAGTAKFAPTPAEIIALMQSQDGRPTADEAWSMVPRSESASAPMTEEIAAAMRSAQPLLDHGDQVGARRAFIDTYTAAVAAARRDGTPMKVWFSWGWDPNGRASAVGQAVEMGLISVERAQAFAAHLPAPEAIAPLLENAAGGIKRIK